MWSNSGFLDLFLIQTAVRSEEKKGVKDLCLII